MASFNKVILVGNLTRDPQLKYLPSQLAVAEFGLAVNHKFRTKTGEEREEVLFIDCSCFGKGGEIINQYCQKGKQILVEGRLRLDQWDDKQTGQKKSKLGVVAETVQFLGSPAGEGGGAPAPRAQRPAAPAASAPAAEPVEGDGPPESDDVPF